MSSPPRPAGTCTWAATAAWTSRRASELFFQLFGAFYFADGLLGLFTGSGYLDFGILINGVLNLPLSTRFFANAPHLGLGGVAILIGLSTFQGEFDFGVPQFRQVLHPILIMLAAGIGLVTARIYIGRGGALQAVAGFIVIRGFLAIMVGGVWDQTTPHFPLYIVEALLVKRERNVVNSVNVLRTDHSRFFHVAKQGDLAAQLVHDVGEARLVADVEIERDGRRSPPARPPTRMKRTLWRTRIRRMAAGSNTEVTGGGSRPATTND